MPATPRTPLTVRISGVVIAASTVDITEAGGGQAG